MSKSGKREGETMIHAGIHCIASERSWQTALVSPAFLFSSSWLREKSAGPRWVGDGCASAAALRFLPALQSHPGRGIMKKTAFPTSPAPVSCMPVSSYLSVSVFFYSCCLFLAWETLFFSPHLLFSFRPSWGAQSRPVGSGCFLTSSLKQEKKGWAERQKGQLP